MNEKEIKRWWKRFKRCINDMPESVELVIDGERSASLYRSGALHDRHLGSDMDGFGMTEECLESCRFKAAIYPYGEGQ